MKSVLRALAIASLLFSLPVLSADKTTDQSADLAEGTVKKIDAPTQRVMLAHGPIANLGMPPMTMMFKVRDAAMLKPLKAGDKVRFRASWVGLAAYQADLRAASCPSAHPAPDGRRPRPVAAARRHRPGQRVLAYCNRYPDVTLGIAPLQMRNRVPNGS